MVTSENKRIHTPPCPLHSKLGCLLFSIGSSNRGTSCMEGMGEEKLYFHPLKSAKRKKHSLGWSVSTHFLANWIIAWFKTSSLLTSFFFSASLAAALVADLKSSAACFNFCCWSAAFGFLAAPCKITSHQYIDCCYEGALGKELAY